MNEFFSQLPTSIVGWIALIGFAFLTFAQVILLIRRNDVKVLRESNDDLRERIEELTLNVQLFKKQLADLRSANVFLVDIVNNALSVYLEKHPQAVTRIKSKISRNAPI